MPRIAKALDDLPITIRTVTEGGHTVRFIEIGGPVPVRWWEAPRPRLRLNPVNDIEE